MGSSRESGLQSKVKVRDEVKVVAKNLGRGHAAFFLAVVHMLFDIGQVRLSKARTPNGGALVPGDPKNSQISR